MTDAPRCGLNRRQYMKLSVGSIEAPAIAGLVFCLMLLRYERTEP